MDVTGRKKAQLFDSPVDGLVVYWLSRNTKILGLNFHLYFTAKAFYIYLQFHLDLPFLLKLTPMASVGVRLTDQLCPSSAHSGFIWLFFHLNNCQHFKQISLGGCENILAFLFLSQENVACKLAVDLYDARDNEQSLLPWGFFLYTANHS
ncbi:hypothetical protein [Aeromonas hydrophila]|uniref:hypothetical protein n=1 Tax=Aeromonas hydrophila TaxID=644 RepID=UPI002361B363|nr:hypothetical protein [Aeromonas hydrophila]